MASQQKLRVLVWDENPHHASKELYPNGIRGGVLDGLVESDTLSLLDAKSAHLDEPEQGVTDEILANTDVLVWWGHARHGEVKDELAERVAKRVQEGGMGFVALHSAHYSKTFKKVINGKGDLKGGWRESTDTEELTVCAPWHPIAEGVEDFILDNEEMYGGPFDVPPHEVLVLQSYFPLGGEVFPAGICWTVGTGIDPAFTSGPGKGVGQGHGVGRVFYFRPGHETYPTYLDHRIRRVIYNAVKWAGKLT
jgi:trehalose utilization protein